jgi:hypothetical protein
VRELEELRIPVMECGYIKRANAEPSASDANGSI